MIAKAVAFGALIAGAGLASAQSLSSHCLTTLETIVANKDAASCLNAGALIGLFTTSANESLVEPIDKWVTGMCSDAQCSNSTLNAIVTNVTSGCSSDLQGIGLSGLDASSISSIVQQAYPTVRQIACLKEYNNTMCVTEELTNLQTVVGTLSVNNIISSISGIVANAASIPKNDTCTPCAKAAYSVAEKNFPSLVGSTQSTLQSQCGFDFTDGTMPSNVEVTASSASASSTKSAASALVVPKAGLMGAAVSGVVAVAFALAVLA
ncbi:hypothetical protein PUNSTDRAFT_98637 [Punctularia strigosozonata HHB-11173 SS5]|uniref:uncharacterized protein n=1 Tax=Punctularia strigosozonata (strain HHB-11173) TaxID=741275 RepID=UPI0004417541|nr:uncharacterized protein PUNSTDRAFT_98637 [Punctularia strigosozonata HHB-11173 SS5]EIN11516.1 hypothetical protein PUNSTDRAFT_98637 [Punctularia strigosozonata HHB-11173 SS5]